MKIFNICLNKTKLLFSLIIIISTIFVILAISNFAKQILASNYIEITNDNYTTVLMNSYENIEKYKDKKISVTGYVFRLPEFSNNEFVIARDMLINDTKSQVVGFLCNYAKISEYETNSWVKINGTIKKGHYFGEIPIIKVDSIKKVTTPNEIFVAPPQDLKSN